MIVRFLDIAPHCSLPPRDGGERRAWHLYEELVRGGLEGTFIGRNACSQDLKVSQACRGTSSWRDHKLTAALFAFITGRDYWQLKMLTPEVTAEVSASRDTADAVYIHFLYSVALLRHFRGRRLRLLVDTHNYDPAVFEGFRRAAHNSLARALCRRAIRNSRKALASLPSGTVLVHVSESDADAYRQDRSDLHHVVIENGGWAIPRHATPDYALPGIRKLLFVGSLSAQMNQNALHHLAKTFWPALRDVAHLTVVGSNPPATVVDLCQREGWDLCADATEEDLNEKYAAAHYAVLPFAYGAGSKLKLMEACGRGVPVLATEAGITGITPPPLVHVSDEPMEWRRTLEQNNVPSKSDLEVTHEFSKRLSWPSLATRLATIIHEAPLTTLE